MHLLGCLGSRTARVGTGLQSRVVTMDGRTVKPVGQATTRSMVCFGPASIHFKKEDQHGFVFKMSGVLRCADQPCMH